MINITLLCLQKIFQKQLQALLVFPAFLGPLGFRKLEFSATWRFFFFFFTLGLVNHSQLSLDLSAELLWWCIWFDLSEVRLSFDIPRASAFLFMMGKLVFVSHQKQDLMIFFFLITSKLHFPISLISESNLNTGLKTTWNQNLRFMTFSPYHLNGHVPPYKFTKLTYRRLIHLKCA